MRNGFLDNLPDLGLESKRENKSQKNRKPTICSHQWRIVKTIKLFTWIRRYKICRLCGKHIRTKEFIEK